MQKVINDVEENKFISVWSDLFNQTMADIRSYFDLAYESRLLGGLIFDNSWSQIAKIISRDLFVKTYWKIFEEQKKNGTIDAHLYILSMIFGENSEIFVENQNPLHVKFNILSDGLSLDKWITKAGDEMMTKDGDNLMFRTILLGLSNAELASLLKATANYGCFIEFEITTTPITDPNDFGEVSEGFYDIIDYGLVTETATTFTDYGTV